MEENLNKFKEAVAELAREESNFKKDSASRKTAEYIGKKLAKATSIYSTIKTLAGTLATQEVDPCIELEKTNAEELYVKYVKALKSYVVEQPQTSSGNASQQIVINHIRKQNVLFEAIRKLIEDVEGKVDMEMSIAFCQLKLKALDDSWNRVQVADEDLKIDRTTLPNSYSAQLLEYEGAVERVMLLLQEKLMTLTPMGKTSQPDEVKLPRVVIPKFNGDYFKWMTFRDLFCTMVKDKRSLSDGQRMQMLKTLVDGEAAVIIADLTIADVNFASAWNRLTERYDNNRIVVYKHLSKLINQQNAKGDSKSIKKILDTTDQILLALRNLGRPIESWDDWVILTVTQKLSEDARKDWEKRTGPSTTLPTWDQLKQFLAEHFRMLEGLENSHKREPTKTFNKTEKNVMRTYQATVSTKDCPACDGEHKLFTCSVFKSMKVKQRWEMAKKKKLCFACLHVHEDKLSCDKEKPCKKCNKRHSTWLHDENKDNKKSDTTIVSAHAKINTGNHPSGLLATMLVLVQNNLGKLFYLRALLDSGSQASMITSKAAAMIKQQFVNTSVHISGLGGNQNGKSSMIFLTMKPRFRSDFSMNIGCYILTKLKEPLPNKDIDSSTWEHIKNLTLADPTFNMRGDIDLLLGADVIADIMLPQIIKGPKGTPMAQETELGWIVSGQYHTITSHIML